MPGDLLKKCFCIFSGHHCIQYIGMHSLGVGGHSASSQLSQCEVRQRKGVVIKPDNVNENGRGIKFRAFAYGPVERVDLSQLGVFP